MPLVHCSPDKARLTSSVGVYSILNGSFVNRPTTGYPPNGMIFYSCCNIGNDIYYFGGSCKVDDCYHNDLFVLNTTSDKWRQIASNHNDGPIKNLDVALYHSILMVRIIFLLLVVAVLFQLLIVLQTTLSIFLTQTTLQCVSLMRCTSCVPHLHQFQVYYY